MTTPEGRDIDRRLNHAGAIGLLCNVSVMVGASNNIESEEHLDLIEQCVLDYANITGGTVKRILHRVEYTPPNIN